MTNNREMYLPKDVADYSRLYANLALAAQKFQKHFTDKSRTGFSHDFRIGQKKISAAQPEAKEFKFHYSAFSRVPENVRLEIISADSDKWRTIQSLEGASRTVLSNSS